MHDQHGASALLQEPISRLRSTTVAKCDDAGLPQSEDAGGVGSYSHRENARMMGQDEERSGFFMKLMQSIRNFMDAFISISGSVCGDGINPQDEESPANIPAAAKRGRMPPCA